MTQDYTIELGEGLQNSYKNSMVALAWDFRNQEPINFLLIYIFFFTQKKHLTFAFEWDGR